MYRKQALERKVFSPASLLGQGIVAAPKAYFAKQSMERVRRGTAESPVFCVAKNGPKIQMIYGWNTYEKNEILNFSASDVFPVINKYLQYILSLIDFTLPDIYIEYYLLYAENYV